MTFVIEASDSDVVSDTRLLALTGPILVVSHNTVLLVLLDYLNCQPLSLALEREQCIQIWLVKSLNPFIDTFYINVTRSDGGPFLFTDALV